MIQRHKQQYSNMLWNMLSITRHKRNNAHSLHPVLTPDVLTWVLPLGTVRSGRESEVETVHLFLTIIHFFQRFLATQALVYITKSSRIHLYITKVLLRWANGEVVGVGHTGSCSYRPAHRQISSIWSLSVRRNRRRSSAVD